MPDPPDGWLLGGENPKTAKRDHILKRNQVEDFIEFNCWGIDLGISERATMIVMLQAIFKLVYYMAPEHRPKDVGDLVNYKRDAGPRLLSCSLDPHPLPVSRWYPDMPAENTHLHPSYVRPANAAPGMPDAWVQRHMLSSKQRPMPRTEAVDNSKPLGAYLRKLNSFRRPGYRAKDVIESVEKAILRFAYVDLERHHSACPQKPQAHITAVGEGDLLKSVIASTPAVSQVKMTLNPVADTFAFDPNGNLYPSRGRGPVWRNNSSALDCAIVIGRFLDAGSTVIDRKLNGWQKLFSQAAKAFIEATDVNWDVCTPDVSADIRDRLWNILGQTNPEIMVGALNPFYTVWSSCTSDFTQFQYRYTESMTHCPCTGVGSTSETYITSYVTADLNIDESHGKTMQELVARHFEGQGLADCVLCGNKEVVPRTRTFTNLPLRMVVIPRDTQVKGHTQDLKFMYTDDSGTELHAHYRWLGGVYYKNGHYRVIWLDSNRGEQDSGELCYYDSMNNHGLIVGGIPHGHREEKVPRCWAGEGPFPMLIYERIMNPESDVLGVAGQSLQDMMNSQKDGQLIMDAHTPWAANQPPVGLPILPWRRILPDNGQRFVTASSAYTPGSRATPSPATRIHPSPQQSHGYMTSMMPNLNSSFSPMIMPFGTPQMNMNAYYQPQPQPQPQQANQGMQNFYQSPFPTNAAHPSGQSPFLGNAALPPGQFPFLGTTVLSNPSPFPASATLPGPAAQAQTQESEPEDANYETTPRAMPTPLWPESPTDEVMSLCTQDSDAETQPVRVDGKKKASGSGSGSKKRKSVRFSDEYVKESPRKVARRSARRATLPLRVAGV